MEDKYTEQLKMAPLFEPLKIDEEKQMCNAFSCMNAKIEIHLKSNLYTIFVSECTQIFSTTTIRQESLVVYTNVWSVVYSTITNTPHILPCAPLFLCPSSSTFHPPPPLCLPAILPLPQSSIK